MCTKFPRRTLRIMRYTLLYTTLCAEEERTYTCTPRAACEVALVVQTIQIEEKKIKLESQNIILGILELVLVRFACCYCIVLKQRQATVLIS